MSDNRRPMTPETTTLSGYPGGKGAAGVYQHIINRIPKHKFFLEPFFGKGNILWRKRPADRDVGVDVSSDAISAARLRLQIDPAGNRQFFVADGLAVLEILSSELATSAVAAAFGDPAAQPRGTPDLTAVRARAVHSGDSFRNVAANLMKRSEMSIAAESGGMIARGLAASDVVVYCDPPYPLSTRKDKKRIYAIEPGIDSPDDDAWHRRLLNVLDSLPCPVLLSGYMCELYESCLRLPKWRHSSYRVMTRGGGAVTEYLWRNFDEPLELHDYRYLGENRRERERIKRLQKRWAVKLRKMPLIERQSLLATLIDVNNEPECNPNC